MNSGQKSRIGFASGNDFCRTMMLIMVATLLSSCATLNNGSAIGDSLSGIGDKMKSGIQRVTSRGSGSGSKRDDTAVNIAARFPANQMPHTMMKKPVADGRLSSGYGYRINPKGIRLPKRHKGIDYAAPTGTPVYAAASGVIEKLYVSKSYGNYIRIKHENDFFTAYAHMNAFAEGLDTGSKVTRGQLIGQVGSTGKSSGPHLHFELIHKGQFIDPLFESVPATMVASEEDTAEDT